MYIVQRLRICRTLISTPVNVFMALYLMGTGPLPFMVLCFPSPVSFDCIIKLFVFRGNRIPYLEAL